MPPVASSPRERHRSDQLLEKGFVWFHALAIGYSPAYLHENADGILQDWPRIPPPANKADLLRSAELQKIAVIARVAAVLFIPVPTTLP